MNPSSLLSLPADLLRNSDLSDRPMVRRGGRTLRAITLVILVGALFAALAVSLTH